MFDKYGILQKWIKINDDMYPDGRKVKISGIEIDSGLYTIYGKATKLNLEEIDWMHLYTPENIKEMMLKSIYKFTEEKINGYNVLYESNHKPLKIDYYNGTIVINFSTYDFKYYVQIVEGINNTIEDLFSIDGFFDWDNQFTMTYETCILKFTIPRHYIENKIVEPE